MDLDAPPDECELRLGQGVFAMETGEIAVKERISLEQSLEQQARAQRDLPESVADHIDAILGMTDDAQLIASLKRLIDGVRSRLQQTHRLVLADGNAHPDIVLLSAVDYELDQTAIVRMLQDRHKRNQRTGMSGAESLKRKFG
jgi:PHD/YefM family antitoxin component YafN of YafNO toxin-antitoxin module